MERSELIKKLKELEEMADQAAFEGQYAKSAGMYKVILELWRFLRSNE